MDDGRGAMDEGRWARGDGRINRQNLGGFLVLLVLLVVPSLTKDENSRWLVSGVGGREPVAESLCNHIRIV